MIMKEGFDVFIAIIVIVSSKAQEMDVDNGAPQPAVVQVPSRDPTPDDGRGRSRTWTPRRRVLRSPSQRPMAQEIRRSRTRSRSGYYDSADHRDLRASRHHSRSREPSRRHNRSREPSRSSGRPREPFRRTSRPREPSHRSMRSREPSRRSGRSREPSRRSGRSREPSHSNGRSRETPRRSGRSREPSHRSRQADDTSLCTACFSEDDHNNVHTGMTGTQFVKDCVCSKEGYSAEYLTWLDPDGKAILPNGPGTTFSNVYTEIPQDGVVRLIVRSISQSIAGTYTCQTNFEGRTYTKTYKIEAYDNPYFVNTSAVQYAIIGEDSTIRCEVRSNTDHEVYMTWYRVNGGDSMLLSNPEKYIFLQNQGLIIKDVSKDDGGLYNCTVNDVTEGDTAETTINVQVAVRPIIYNVTFSPENILAGDTVTVECIAEGTPYPDYTWTKIADWAGNRIENTSIAWTQNMNAITFGSIQREDAGTYECTVENSVDSASTLVDIEVKVPPIITSLENVTAVEGSQTQIICKATGVPTPLLRIWYDAQGLDEERIISEVKNQTDASELYLTIVNVSRAFERIYLCSADNGVTEENVTQEMYLTVLYKPHFSEPEETVWGWASKTVNMSCEHESNPPSTIVWKFQGNEIEHQTTTAEHVQVNKLLKEQSEDKSAHGYLVLTVDNMTMYGEYECTASNDYGASTKRIHLREAFKPEAIRNVTVMNMSATTVTFLIEGPDTTDNAPVNGFTAEYDLVQNYDIKSVHLTRTCGIDRNFTIDRLRPNSNYSIKFAAQNEVGVGVWSEYIEFETPETSAPEPPILRTNVQNNHGKLRWEPPEANGDPIDHYSVEFCPFFGEVINTTLCETENVSATEFALDKLDRNTKYSFKIRAHNSHGYSDFADKEMTTPEKLVRETVLSAGAIIGLSVVVVFLCLLVLDLLLLCFRRQGIIASCYFRKNKKKKEDTLQQRDKKGLLVKEGTDDSLTRPNNGHRELVYNKTTGVITGKHSTV